MKYLQDPWQEKQRDYDRQRRLCGVSGRYNSRKSDRRFRERAHRAERRSVRQVLDIHTWEFDGSYADALQDGACRVQQVVMGKHSTWEMSLRDYLECRRDYRVLEAVRKYFSQTYDSVEHREAFIRFLEAAIAGGVLDTPRLAERLAHLLDGTQLHYTNFVPDFLEDVPEWREQLSAWLQEHSAG